ncbi:MAG: cell division protein FtsX [Rhodospirillales bacterium]
MATRQSVLALDRDPLDRFLPWLIAFMVYLAVVALAGVLVIDDVARRWQQGLADVLTVEIAAADSAEADARNRDAALAVLRATPGVADARPIPDSQVAALLEPWLGPTDVARELPLPRLIDVRLRPGIDLDADLLAARLAGAVPGAVVDDHRSRSAHLLRVARTVDMVAVLALTLIAGVVAGTVVSATRSALVIHLDTVEVLHLIGAQDAFVAGQFADRALALGLRGGVIGLLLGVATLVGIDRLAARMLGESLPDLALAPAHWLLLAALPIAVAAIAMLTARTTVMRTLARTP